MQTSRSHTGNSQNADRFRARSADPKKHQKVNILNVSFLDLLSFCNHLYLRYAAYKTGYMNHDFITAYQTSCISDLESLGNRADIFAHTMLAYSFNCSSIINSFNFSIFPSILRSNYYYFEFPILAY